MSSDSYDVTKSDFGSLKKHSFNIIIIIIVVVGMIKRNSPVLQIIYFAEITQKLVFNRHKPPVESIFMWNVQILHPSESEPSFFVPFLTNSSWSVYEKADLH